MATWNLFGAVYSDVVELYPDTVLTDYATNSETGDLVLNKAMTRITRDIVRSMPPAVLESLYQVDAEQVVRYATAGQTSGISLGILPMLAGTCHLWRYPSLAAMESPILYGYAIEFAFRRPVKGFNEVSTSDYTVNATTGAIVLGGSIAAGLNVGERVFATYDVDTENELFALPSVADLVLYGTAAEVGSKLFSEASSQWKLAADYKERYDGAIEDLKDGTWIPDEIRRLHHWVEVLNKNTEVKSVRVHRA